LRGLVRQLSIDQFENEGRRVMGVESAAKSGRTPMFERSSMDPGSIHKVCVLVWLPSRLPCSAQLSLHATTEFVKFGMKGSMQASHGYVKCLQQ
jgi:hypothetical protein